MVKNKNLNKVLFSKTLRVLNKCFLISCSLSTFYLSDKLLPIVWATLVLPPNCWDKRIFYSHSESWETKNEIAKSL